MLNTKLFLGINLVILGGFFYKNPLNQNHYISIGKTNKTIITKQETQTSGKEIYTDFCMQCHGANGKGDAKNFPALDGSDWLTKKRTQSIHAVKFGLSGEIIVNKMKFNNTMPPMGLSNQEVADVMNYILTAWSNKQTKLVTETEVAEIVK